jgi:hypothetical protein
MAKRFMLGTNRTTQEQDAQFINILKTRWPNAGWWHQLSETWFVIDPADNLTADILRDAAKEAFPGIYLMVVEIGTGRWSSFGSADSFPWMRGQWEKFR